MPSIIQGSRPPLRLVEPLAPQEVEWSWFCGRCAAPARPEAPPGPNQRVCPSCQLGLMLEAPADAVPTSTDAFLMIDAALLVQGVSRQAERLLDVTESDIVNRPVHELVVPADAEAQGPSGLAAAVFEAMSADDTVAAFVRPWNTFGVRMRARVSPCGPPRAALLVLDTAPSDLRAV